MYGTKEFSTLTKVSVRTLHHYDSIGLLKPSGRHPNGRRLYDEADRLKLQHILALKFMGFGLYQIKHLLHEEITPLEGLRQQKNIIEQKISSLREGYHALLEQLTSNLEQGGKTIQWDRVTKLREIFNIAETLKKTWIGQIYTDEQIRQLAEVLKNHTTDQIMDYSNRWEKLIEKVKDHHLHEEPTSTIGQKLGQEWVTLFKEGYKKFPELEEAIKKTYQSIELLNPSFDQTIIKWVKKATEKLT